MVPAVLNSNNIKNGQSTTGQNGVLLAQNMQLLRHKLYCKLYITFVPLFLINCLCICIPGVVSLCPAVRQESSGMEIYTGSWRFLPLSLQFWHENVEFRIQIFLTLKELEVGQDMRSNSSFPHYCSGNCSQKETCFIRRSQVCFCQEAYKILSLF